jgi:hypothetical protein
MLANPRHRRHCLLASALLLASACAGWGPSQSHADFELLGFRDDAVAWRRRTPEGDTAELVRLPAGPTLASRPVDGAVGVAALRLDWALVPPPPPSLDPVDGLTLSIGRAAGFVRRGTAALVATDASDGESVSLTALAVGTGGAPELVGHWPAPDGRHLVVATRRLGATSLHVVEPAVAHARLELRRGLARWTAGDRHGAALAWERALSRDPATADALYDLACAHAVGGDLARAADELRLVVSIDPVRYRRLARSDPDLETLLQDPELSRLVSASP